MGGQPQISVIIPAYNAEPFLDETLESVFQQGYDPLEIIVVNDGSEDGTAEIAAAYGNRIKYIYQQNQGPPAARNRGLDLARGEIIAFLDADDWWSKDKLDLQLRYLQDDLSVEIVAGHTQEVRLSETDDGGLEPVPLRASQPMLSMGSALIRRSVFAKIGRFDEELLFCDDIDWFLRAREKNVSMLFLPEVTLYYRKHEHNITNNSQLEMKYRLRAFKKSINRRRSGLSGGDDIQLKKWSDFQLFDEGKFRT